MSEIYAEVTLTNGKVTADSTVTVEGTTAPLRERAANGWAVAPARITSTLEDMGYRTLEIVKTVTAFDSVCRVRVERDSA